MQNAFQQPGSPLDRMRLFAIGIDGQDTGMRKNPSGLPAFWSGHEMQIAALHGWQSVMTSQQVVKKRLVGAEKVTGILA